MHSLIKGLTGFSALSALRRFGGVYNRHTSPKGRSNPVAKIVAQNVNSVNTKTEARRAEPAPIYRSFLLSPRHK